MIKIMEFLKSLTASQENYVEKSLMHLSNFNKMICEENDFLRNELRLYACECKRSSSCLEEQCGWRAARALERKLK